MAGVMAQSRSLLMLLIPLLLLLSTRQNSAQNIARHSSNSTDQPEAAKGNWTVLEDGSSEIHDFTGPAILAPDLQKGSYLRIANSIIETIPEEIFPVDANITDATLEIINTTIHRWNANIMTSFANVTVTNSIIKRLNRSSIYFRRGLQDACEKGREYSIVVTLHATTIDQLDRGALDLDRAVLNVIESTIGALHGRALQLGHGTQLRMVDTVIGALETDAFCQACSNRIDFERNQLLHVPAHTLHFGGSPFCNPERVNYRCPLYYAPRRVVTTATRLPCGPLGWLRDALDSCGSLTDQAREEYVQFRDSSNCSDRAESVQSFLSREPEPDPEPPSHWSWCHSPSAAAGVAVALAVGFLVTGLLIGHYYRRAREAAGRDGFQRADSRCLQGGDADISLPLQPVRRQPDGKRATEADAHNSEPDGRYGPGPVNTPLPARPRVRTPSPSPPRQDGQSAPSAATARPVAQRSPRPPRPEQQRQRRGRRQRAAGPQPDQRQTYENQWPRQAGGGQEPLYENQPQPRQQARANQRRLGAPTDAKSEVHLYGNLHLG